MTERVAALLRNGWYAGLVSPEAWAADFAELSRIDKHAEAAASNWTWTAVGGFVGGVLSVCFLASDDMLMTDVGVGGLVFGALAFVGGLVMRALAKRHDYEDRRYALANEVVSLLAADLAPGARLAIRLDLRPLDGSKVIGRRKVQGWDEVHMADPFLRIRGKLCDGTGVALQVVQHLRTRGKWKTSSRGKMKHKSKRAEWLVAAVRLKLDPQRARAAAEASRRNPRALVVPPGAHAGPLRTEKGLAAQAWTERPWTAPALGAAQFNARELVGLLLVSMFQLLGVAEGAKARSA